MTSTPPFDSAKAAVPLTADTKPHRWSPLTRIAFRFAFCYFGVYCICNGNATIFGSIPKYGDIIQDKLSDVFILPAQYLAQHLFHVPEPGAHLHPTGSGDTAIIWIATLLLLVVSLVATAVWSILDRRRPHYQTLAAWLRFLIRLTLGFGMVTYGLAKIFPLQMSQPSVAALAEPFGMHSPMSLLWYFIGLNPAYEMVCGTAEFLGGILLLFRRTALAGALLTAFVVTNVLLYNLFFDVPVKLYAGHLLMLCLVVIIPDARPLWCFFWSHQPAAPSGVWVPPTSRKAFRRATIGIEIVFALLAILGNAYGLNKEWREQQAKSKIPCPLCGAWHIDDASLVSTTGTPIPHPVLSNDHHAFAELDINSPERAVFRDDHGVSTRFPLKTDDAKHTLQFTRDNDSTITYNLHLLDPIHLRLTPTGPEEHTASALSLTLIMQPNAYPLMTRGFHWVSEYPYQR